MLPRSDLPESDPEEIKDRLAKQVGSDHPRRLPGQQPTTVNRFDHDSPVLREGVMTCYTFFIWACFRILRGFKMARQRAVHSLPVRRLRSATLRRKLYERKVTKSAGACFTTASP